MKQYVIDGQIGFFDDLTILEEPKPAKKQKPRKPKAEKFPFQCNISTRYVTVYAQHPAHAYKKCEGMYGCCIGTPKQII